MNKQHSITMRTDSIDWGHARDLQDLWGVWTCVQGALLSFVRPTKWTIFAAMNHGLWSIDYGVNSIDLNRIIWPIRSQLRLESTLLSFYLYIHHKRLSSRSLTIFTHVNLMLCLSLNRFTVTAKKSTWQIFSGLDNYRFTLKTRFNGNRI